MIIMEKASELKAARQFGQCISCGAESFNTEIYVFNFVMNNDTHHTSIRLCEKCMEDMVNTITANESAKYIKAV